VAELSKTAANVHISSNAHAIAIITNILHSFIVVYVFELIRSNWHRCCLQKRGIGRYEKGLKAIV
jgi:hypothetical protein